MEKQGTRSHWAMVADAFLIEPETRAAEKQGVKMKKNAMAAIIIALVVIALISVSCINPAEFRVLIPSSGINPAEFQVTNLSISPPEVIKGEPATLTADIENVGGSGTYQATLVIDGVEVETKEVALPAGAKDTVMFTVTRDTCGTCQVELCGLSGSLRVLEAADFELVDLFVPGEVVSGQPTTISAEVRNTGNVVGDYTACLVVDETEVASKTITLAPGVTGTVSFTVTKETPGSYPVRVGELKGTLKVLEPARFEVSDVEVYPNPVVVGDRATVTATVRNIGEAGGTFTASLKVEGVLEDSNDITLDGGGSGPVTFSVSRDSVGSCAIDVDGRKATLEVIEAVRLDTGTFVVQEMTTGSNRMGIDNTLLVDAVVVVCSVDSPDIPLIAVYIQSLDSYKIKGIKRGTYLLYFTTGKSWDDRTHRFISAAEYMQLPGEFECLSSASTYWIWWIDLQLEDVITLSEAEFPKI